MQREKEMEMAGKDANHLPFQAWLHVCVTKVQMYVQVYEEKEMRRNRVRVRETEEGYGELGDTVKKTNGKENGILGHGSFQRYTKISQNSLEQKISIYMYVCKKDFVLIHVLMRILIYLYVYRICMYMHVFMYN